MFCSKCGHKLNDDDAFCQNCGAPIHLDKAQDITSKDEIKVSEQKDKGESFLTSWSELKKIIVYTISTTILILILCIMGLPSGVSTAEFIVSPRGFTAIWASNLGASLLPSLLFLPLIGGLHKLGLTKNYYRIEAFYLIFFINALGLLFFGRTVWSRQYLPPIMITGFIIGVIAQLVGRKRKK